MLCHRSAWGPCAEFSGIVVATQDHSKQSLSLLNKRVPARSSYHLKQLPETTLACAYSGLADESAEQTYAAIRKWMTVRAYRLAGPKRELYLGQMLEIQFPLVEN